MGRTLGIILLIGGFIVGAIVIVLMTVYYREGSLTAGAATLGAAGLILVLVLPQLGFGGYLLWYGQQETAVSAKRDQQRKLLNIVKTRGQVHVSDIVLEMNATRDEVHEMIHQLVGMGLYSGYINWDEGMLYSAQAGALRELTNCKHCNGELELAGKGVVRCPFCSTEYFLE
ncbi:MAG: hypothetical protein AAF614_17655 [Chloroflexota bacterium]